MRQQDQECAAAQTSAVIQWSNVLADTFSNSTTGEHGGARGHGAATPEWDAEASFVVGCAAALDEDAEASFVVAPNRKPRPRHPMKPRGKHVSPVCLLFKHVSPAIFCIFVL